MSLAENSHASALLRDCPCCGGTLGEPFYSFGLVPVHTCLMLDNAEAAEAFPQADVRLAQCSSCGFVTNTNFDHRWSTYSPDYEDQQGFSPTFHGFAERLARGLIERHGLAGKSAVEIGCSKGDFLALLCEVGGMDTVGIDPSVVPGRVKNPLRGTMRLLSEYYGTQHMSLPADLICSRHMLEHVQNVHEILTLMRRHAELNPGAVLCIEVPDAQRIWDKCAFEDIYYEHCSYFTPGTLAAVVRRVGFSVLDLRREYDDQYLVLEAVLDPEKDRQFEIEEGLESAQGVVTRFAHDVVAGKDRWRDYLLRLHAEGSKIAIWGSGSKCVSFLLTLDAASCIDMVVDINPYRTGKYAPGLTLPIHQPDALREIDPDLIIVMNPIYRDEIAAHCQRIGLSSKLLALGDIPSVDRV